MVDCSKPFLTSVEIFSTNGSHTDREDKSHLVSSDSSESALGKVPVSKSVPDKDRGVKTSDCVLWTVIKTANFIIYPPIDQNIIEEKKGDPKFQEVKLFKTAESDLDFYTQEYANRNLRFLYGIKGPLIETSLTTFTRDSSKALQRGDPFTGMVVRKRDSGCELELGEAIGRFGFERASRDVQEKIREFFPTIHADGLIIQISDFLVLTCGETGVEFQKMFKELLLAMLVAAGVLKEFSFIKGSSKAVSLIVAVLNDSRHPIIESKKVVYQEVFKKSIEVKDLSNRSKLIYGVNIDDLPTLLKPYEVDGEATLYNIG